MILNPDPRAIPLAHSESQGCLRCPLPPGLSQVGIQMLAGLWGRSISRSLRTVGRMQFAWAGVQGLRPPRLLAVGSSAQSGVPGSAGSSCIQSSRAAFQALCFTCGMDQGQLCHWDVKYVGALGAPCPQPETTGSLTLRAAYWLSPGVRHAPLPIPTPRLSLTFRFG